MQIEEFDYKRDCLVIRPTASAPECLEDLLHLMMANVEDGLLNAGARPGKDYTYRELLQAATPLVRSIFNRGDVSFQTEFNPDMFRVIEVGSPF